MCPTRFALRSAIITFVLLDFVAYADATEFYQRMVLISGTYTIGGGSSGPPSGSGNSRVGGSSGAPSGGGNSRVGGSFGPQSGGSDNSVSIRTYCLDRFVHQPPRGHPISLAPPGLGSTFVTVEGEKPKPLSEALGVTVALEGTGGVLSLRMKSLVPGKKITIEVKEASIVIPGSNDDMSAKASEYPQADIQAFYPKLRKTLHDGSPGLSTQSENLGGAELPLQRHRSMRCCRMRDPKLEQQYRRQVTTPQGPSFYIL